MPISASPSYPSCPEAHVDSVTVRVCTVFEEEAEAEGMEAEGEQHQYPVTYPMDNTFMFFRFYTSRKV
jgi:hypothetical protein